MITKAKSGRRSTEKSASRSTARTAGKSKSASAGRSKTQSDAKRKAFSSSRGKTQSGVMRKAAASSRSKTQSGAKKATSSRRTKAQSGTKRKTASPGRSRTQSSARKRSPMSSRTQAGRQGTASSGRGRTQPGSKGQTTRDHDIIRHWAEQRAAKPTMVEGTQILRLNFAEPGGDDDDRLKEVSWEEFFQVFDDSDLSFLYSEDRRGTDEPVLQVRARGVIPGSAMLPKISGIFLSVGPAGPG
jgi:hypothetical protein